jgi:hypothetical protein
LFQTAQTRTGLTAQAVNEWQWENLLLIKRSLLKTVAERAHLIKTGLWDNNLLLALLAIRWRVLLPLAQGLGSVGAFLLFVGGSCCLP